MEKFQALDYARKLATIDFVTRPSLFACHGASDTFREHDKIVVDIGRIKHGKR